MGAVERVEAAVAGVRWTTGLTRPPFVATCSVWESTRALATYAYGAKDAGHPSAVAASEAKAFHRRQAFVRFRPYYVEGSLSGANPLGGDVLTV